MKFGTIIADPPWNYEKTSYTRHGPPPPHDGPRALRGYSDLHYAHLTTNDLVSLPVEKLAADDSVLFLWTTGPFLASGDAREVALAWGFSPVTLMYWRKTTKSGDRSHGGGVGYWFRGNCEPILVAKRGEAHRWSWNERWTADDANALFDHKTLGHSRKPDTLHERVERSGGTRARKRGDETVDEAYAGYPSPWLELFARRGRTGWLTCGDVDDGDIPLSYCCDIREALGLLSDL